MSGNEDPAQPKIKSINYIKKIQKRKRNQEGFQGCLSLGIQWFPPQSYLFLVQFYKVIFFSYAGLGWISLSCNQSPNYFR